jgi:Mg/Co/Ni transporter MgtE
LVPSECESVQQTADSGADRLAVIADLLADLPDAERREVIAELPPADRAAIARLLIGSNRQGGTE